MKPSDLLTCCIMQVRCQAGGLPVGAAVKQLAAAGGAVNVLKQLYAGVISASIASVAVGMYILVYTLGPWLVGHL